MSAVLAATRRLEFPGKRRLRRLARLPVSGVREVDLVGARFRLDLAESLHRDYYFGLCDQLELRLIGRLLQRGGDFVDVGAHVGLYAVSTARKIRGRVLALEPNPRAYARLKENVELNSCANVIVEQAAASAEIGHATLHMPQHGDSSWSSLLDGRVADGVPVDVETTTIDAEVRRFGLTPAVVKVDVEGCEVEVLSGAAAVLVTRPALLIELVESNASAVVAALQGLGYLVARAGTRRLEPWRSPSGASNAVFLQPWHLGLLAPRARRVFSGGVVRRHPIVARSSRPAAIERIV
ncbi:MAG: FkbM family methyltransferase [Gaiellaceae bacterium]